MSKQRPPTYRFSWLRLRNWKNFLEAELPLGQRVFLVGPNASGQSNLLDVFRFLRDLVSEGGGLQAAVNRRGGVRALRCLAARRYSDIEIAVRVARSDSEAPEDYIWQYELVFNQDNRRRAVIQREKVTWRDPHTGKERSFLERPTSEDTADPERLTQTHLEQITMNQAFRELASFFASVQYLHIVPQLIRESDRSVGRKHDPYGGDFLEQIARTSEKTRKAWLQRIQEALTVAVPQLKEIELWRDERGTPPLCAQYEHWRLRGAWQTEEQLSDGTLRLLGLLWSLLEGRGPLLLEEPELSLHPEVIRYVPEMFARVQRRTGRQILVSTHSAELLQAEGIAPEEVVLLQPGREATEVRRVADIQEAQALLKEGRSAGEIAVSLTQPAGVEQLPRFGNSPWFQSS